MDVGITFTRLPTVSINPRLFCRLINTGFSVGFDVTMDVDSNQANTEIVFTDLQGERTWQTGATNALEILIFDNAGTRNYDYTVDFIRIRTDGTDTPFEPTGGGPGINTGISETVNGLNLNQFYGVDDGTTED